MDVDELTIGQAKEIASLFPQKTASPMDSFAANKVVLVRTYSAGVWAGLLARKAGAEVILRDARRLWYWKCAKSISLSGVAVYGIDQKESKIAAPVDAIWLEAIEIIPLAKEPADSIMGAPIVDAQ